MSAPPSFVRIPRGRARAPPRRLDLADLECPRYDAGRARKRAGLPRAVLRVAAGERAAGPVPEGTGRQRGSVASRSRMASDRRPDFLAGHAAACNARQAHGACSDAPTSNALGKPLTRPGTGTVIISAWVGTATNVAAEEVAIEPLYPADHGRGRATNGRSCRSDRWPDPGAALAQIAPEGSMELAARGMIKGAGHPALHAADLRRGRRPGDPGRRPRHTHFGRFGRWLTPAITLIRAAGLCCHAPASATERILRTTSRPTTTIRDMSRGWPCAD
jgi:hypothetical protein